MAGCCRHDRSSYLVPKLAARGRMVTRWRYLPYKRDLLRSADHRLKRPLVADLGNLCRDRLERPLAADLHNYDRGRHERHLAADLVSLVWG